MAFVVDASMVLAWLLPDEDTEYAETFLERWMKGDVISAPELIRYEVSNAIVMAATRRGRLSDSKRLHSEFYSYHILFALGLIPRSLLRL